MKSDYLKPQSKPFIFTAALFVAVVLVSLFFLALINGWLGVWDHTGDDFCEASRPGLIKQPSNTWSNIGFIVAGLTMAWQLAHEKYKQNKNVFTQSNFTAIFFSSIAVFLGPGSMAMHATETSAGGFFDMLSMYLVAGFASAYAMQRFFSWNSLRFALCFVFIVVLCVCVKNLPYRMPVVGYFGNFVFAVFVSVSVVFEFLNSFVRKFNHQVKWGVLSLVSLLVAFLIWNLERRVDYFCNPYSVIQGHAIWHLLDALAVYFLFRFYVSEHVESSR